MHSVGISPPDRNRERRSAGRGISRSGQQHSPAICVQHRGPMSHPAIEDIPKRAKDEVDVRTGAQCPPSRPQPSRPVSMLMSSTSRRVSCSLCEPIHILSEAILRLLTAFASVIAVPLVAPAATQQGVLPPERSVVATQVHADVTELDIYADVLETDRAIRLPHTRVRIYAGEVSFRDPDPNDPGEATIDTTPVRRSDETQ